MVSESDSTYTYIGRLGVILVNRLILHIRQVARHQKDGTSNIAGAIELSEDSWSHGTDNTSGSGSGLTSDGSTRLMTTQLELGTEQGMKKFE